MTDPLAPAIKALGPKGGDLDVMHNPSKVEWRRKGFNPPEDPTIELPLHRFSKQETATPGMKNEQPWHRMAAYMLNAGRTNSEIAAAANVSPITVSQLRSNKWFQELCAVIANNAGEEVLGAVKSYALEAVEGIHEIAVSAESDRVRLSAFQLLLEHSEGKPVQKILSNVSHSVHTTPAEEMAAIETELKALRTP